MSYIVFARKWRPQVFDEIIGQEHITETLKNAIKNDRVAHAYIFTGPRGIGKTSAARILAKSLNCQKGPTPEPCNKCTSCREISESKSFDVLEIDGASNRGIDEIRNLRENVKFAPTQGKYKVYIIDEVHMLTTEAFNALLKTLEEPPAHVKFIFATTQPNKVLATILSRCQRFDFRRIATKDIVLKLKSISDKENLKISDDAVFAIAKAALGSLRDAESILDQLASFTNRKIEISDVSQVLGALNESNLLEIVDAIIKKDAAAGLKLIDSLVKEGKDLSYVCTELLECFRNILIAKVGKNLDELIDLPQDSISKISALSREFTIEDLLYILNVLSSAQELIRKSDLNRIPLEMAIVKLAKRDSIRSLKEILDRISAASEKIPAAEDDITPEEEPPHKAVKETSLPRPQPAEEDENIETETKLEAVRPAETSADLKKIEEIWPNLIRNVKVKKMSIATCLLESRPVSFDGTMLTLGFPKGCSFHKEVIEKAPNKKIIIDTLSEFLGVKPDFKFVDINEEELNNIGSDGPSQKDKAAELDAGGAAGARPNPLVDSALDIFGGRIINKKRPGE